MSAARASSMEAGGLGTTIYCLTDDSGQFSRHLYGIQDLLDPIFSAYIDLRKSLILSGGRGGIRTHGALTGTPDFESGTFDHSATLPSDRVGEDNERGINSK